MQAAIGFCQQVFAQVNGAAAFVAIGYKQGYQLGL
jgi:hypothetical protein